MLRLFFPKPKGINMLAPPKKDDFGGKVVIVQHFFLVSCEILGSLGFRCQPHRQVAH